MRPNLAYDSEGHDVADIGLGSLLWRRLLLLVLVVLAIPALALAAAADPKKRIKPADQAKAALDRAQAIRFS